MICICSILMLKLQELYAITNISSRKQLLVHEV